MYNIVWKKKIKGTGIGSAMKKMINNLDTSTIVRREKLF